MGSYNNFDSTKYLDNIRMKYIPILIFAFMVIACEALPKHPGRKEHDELKMMMAQLAKGMAEIKEKLADLEADLMILESSPKTCEHPMDN